MSISKQIILSSTLVAFLAAFAGYLGWKNLKALKAKLLERDVQSPEAINNLIENIDGLNFWIVLICGLIFLLAIVFGQVIAYFLSKSLNELKAVASDLSDGKFDTQTTITANNEFGKIGQSFNNVVNNLQQAQIIEEKNNQLAELNERLKVKNDSLDSFVYRVSHDLKAPLVNLTSLQNLIKSQIKDIDNKLLQTSFEHLDKTTKRLGKTIYDLLEVSRIERNLKAEKEWIDLTKVVEEAKEENSDTIKATEAKIIANFNKAPKVHFSKNNMNSLIGNLLSNGLKYRSEDRTPIIKIQTETSEDFICLSISDNGIGMDLERHKEKLFGMFNRFHNHVEGSGVGLYIVKKLIEENGGRVEVESTVGEGTTFKLFFRQPNSLQNATASLN